MSEENKHPLPLTYKDLVYKRRGDVVHRGWYYFIEDTNPKMSTVIYDGMRIIKDDGAYHCFTIKSIDGKYTDMKTIKKKRPNDRINLVELNMGRLKYLSRRERLDQLKELSKEKKKQIKLLQKELDYYTDYMNIVMNENQDYQPHKTALIVVTGWLGDALYASPIAEQLKNQLDYTRVDYLIGFPQTQLILKNNIYIDQVYVYPELTPYPKAEKLIASVRYDSVFTLPVNDLKELPTIKYQKFCGIPNPEPEFKCSIPAYFVSNITTNKTIIGVSSTWKDYNENYRDVDYIISELSNQFHNLKFVKLGDNISQFEGSTPENVASFYEMLATMKECEYVIGAEGGMLNFASSLGTKTICATDFTEALFGKNGKMYQYKDWEKRITPKAFFKRAGHINLPPTAKTNEEILKEISKILASIK